MCEMSTYFLLPSAPPQERVSAQNPMCHMYYLAIAHIALPRHRRRLRRSLRLTPLSLWLSVCLIAQSGSGTHACSCRAQRRNCQSGDREPLGVPGAAARLASCKVQPHSAARNSTVGQVCLERSRRSSANIYAPTHALTPNQYVFKYSHTPPHMVAR